MLSLAEVLNKGWRCETRNQCRSMDLKDCVNIDQITGLGVAYMSLVRVKNS
jgi:hypothetical protein